MELQKKVIEVIKENTDWKGVINMKQDLVKDLGIDSFGMLMIINTLEEDFSIRVEDEDLEGLKIVSDIVRKLEEKLSVIHY
ncbi:MAG: acyl carrier protein [Bacteroidales bacterium]|nr:acyl carrier protein [Bacteroidales bacterium]